MGLRHLLVASWVLWQRLRRVRRRRCWRQLGAVVLGWSVALGHQGCWLSGGGDFTLPRPVFPAGAALQAWPDVGYVVLDDVATVEFRAAPKKSRGGILKIEAVLDHRRRLQVLRPEGLTAARVVVPTDDFSTVTRVLGRSAAPGGGAVQLDPQNSTLYDVRRASERGADAAAAAPPGCGLRCLAFTIPGAVVGGLIDYRYVKVFSDAALLPPWVFGGAAPVVRAEFNIVAPAEIKVDYRYGRGGLVVENLPLRRQLSDGRDRLLFVEQNIPAYYPEPYMPDLTRVAAWIAVVPTRARVGALRYRLETWADVAAHVRRLAAPVGAIPLDANPQEPQLVFERWRDRLRGVEAPGEVGLGGVRAQAAAKLLAGAVASSRDAALLLTQQLQASQANAQWALLTTAIGPPWVESFPALYPFSGAVVALDVAQAAAREPSCNGPPLQRSVLCAVHQSDTGGVVFLDPLCRGCRFGELPTRSTGGRALLLGDAEVRWVDVPEDPPERNSSVMEYNLVLEVDGSLQGLVNAVVTGESARQVVPRLLRASDAATRSRWLQEAFLGEAAQPAWTVKKVEAAVNASSPLLFVAAVQSRAATLAVEKYVLRPVDFAGPSWSGQWRASQRYAVVLDAPRWHEVTATIDLPVGYQASVPPLVRIVKPFGEFAAGFALQGRSLHYSRRLVITRHVVQAEAWEEFYSFLQEIANADAQQAHLFAVE